MTRAELEKVVTPERLDRLDRNGHTYIDYEGEPLDLVRWNRAGPNESCLTIEAMLRRYAKGKNADDFVLEPSDLHIYKTTGIDENGNEDGLYWVPWAPGCAPERIDDSVDLHAEVRAQ